MARQRLFPAYVPLPEPAGWNGEGDHGQRPHDWLAAGQCKANRRTGGVSYKGATSQFSGDIEQRRHRNRRPTQHEWPEPTVDAAKKVDCAFRENGRAKRAILI